MEHQKINGQEHMLKSVCNRINNSPVMKLIGEDAEESYEKEEGDR
jgi:hypothetical protein